MKWLVIHPKDTTTQFLTDCYKNIKDAVVINNPSAPKKMLRKLIREADNVMLLGHGSKNGLFSTVSKKSKYRFDRIIVDSQFVDDLRKKNKVIGFALGMFVSELSEADYMSLPLDEELIEKSNKMLTTTISTNYSENSNVIYQNFIADFNTLSDNPIADYNSSEIKWFD